MYLPDAPDMDLEKFRLPSSMTRPIPSPKRPPRHRQGEQFLKGPIPWSWLERAGGLPGKALQVAMRLWQEAGFTKRRTVRFRLTAMRCMKIGPQAARRGLRNLEQAGLVSVHRKPGKSLEVTLLEYPTSDPSPGGS
jgi:hypothetical protein